MMFLLEMTAFSDLTRGNAHAEICLPGEDFHRLEQRTVRVDPGAGRN